MSGLPGSKPSWAHLTYARPNLNDHTLDEKNVDQTCPLDIGRHHPEPQHELGMLDRLPYELVADILAQLDLRSLFDFRSVNQRATHAVDGVPQFKQIIKHNSTIIRAMLSIEVGSYVSCIDLLHTLRTEKCDQCGDFAGYIYLLDCSRVCFLCFTEEIRYLPLTAAQVRRKFGIDRSLLFGLPSLKSLSGRYSPNEKLCSKRLVLYDPESARQAGIAMHGSQVVTSKFAADALSRQIEKYEDRRYKYLNGRSGPKPRLRSGALNELDGFSSNPRRFMAIVRAPWISSTTETQSSGFHCAGCRRENRSRPLHWRRKFTPETFEEHIRQSGLIRDGKHDPLALGTSNCGDF